MPRFLAGIAIVVTSLVVTAMPADARGGMHGGSALSAPANPSVPPSLTPDARLTGSAPLPIERSTVNGPVRQDSAVILKPDPEDTAVDRIVHSICRGC